MTRYSPVPTVMLQTSVVTGKPDCSGDTRKLGKPDGVATQRPTVCPQDGKRSGRQGDPNRKCSPWPSSKPSPNGLCSDV